MFELETGRSTMSLLSSLDRFIFGALSPRKQLSSRYMRVSWVFIFEADGKNRLVTLDMLRIGKSLRIPSESGKNNFDPIVVDFGDKVEISYKTGPGQFTPSPFEVARFVPLDRRTFQIFGLIQAECTKRLTYSSFDFSNTSASVVRSVLDYFENIWRVPRERWRVYVEYWRGKLDQDRKGMIVNFWTSQLSIQDWQVKVRVGKKERLSEQASLFGTASIRLNNRIAQVLIMQVLERVRGIVEGDRSAAGAYLCGLFAGDGILLQHKGRLRAVGLSFNPRSDELSHYKKVLAQIGITIDAEKLLKSGKRAIFLTHWRNGIALLEASGGELFLPQRRNAVRFYRGFLANQYIKPLLRLRLLRDRPLTAKEFASAIGVCRRTGNLNLNRCVDLGFLRREAGISSPPFLFHLTDRGKTFLKVVEKVEKFLREG